MVSLDKAEVDGGKCENDPEVDGCRVDRADGPGYSTGGKEIGRVSASYEICFSKDLCTAE